MINNVRFQIYQMAVKAPVKNESYPAITKPQELHLQKQPSL